MARSTPARIPRLHGREATRRRPGTGARSLFAWLALLLALPCGGCSSTPEPPEDQSGRARMIGLIEMVRPNDRFVLIRSLAAVPEPAGTELHSYSRDGTETGRLRLSAERRRSMLTADVLSGNPSDGDYAVIPGEDGEGWMPEALPPVMIDEDIPPATEVSPDLDTLPDLQPPPGVDRVEPGTLPELSLPPGVAPPQDLGPEGGLDLPGPPPPGAEEQWQR